LEQTIAAVVELARKMQNGPGANEANTRRLLIEPLLDELGWNTDDLSQVSREHRVFEGTAIDYVLRVDGQRRLVVEAKAVDINLDDPKFISQTHKYANDAGIVWCVLTNGLRYRIYKTNEPLTMDQKLLFEVDLGASAGGEPGKAAARELELISRSSVEQGRLDLRGERFFTDRRVRQALHRLAQGGSQSLLKAVEKELELSRQPTVARPQLKESLRRVLGVEGDQSEQSGGKAAASRADGIERGAGSRAEPDSYDLSRHTANLADPNRALFEGLDAYIRGLGADVRRKVLKQCVSYTAGPRSRSFASVVFRRECLKVYLPLDPSATAPWEPTVMRDVSKIGHHGNGNLELTLKGEDWLDLARRLILRSYTTRGAA